MTDVQEADVGIVGGGPAGLQAALKTALLYKTAIVFDKGRKHSRVFFSPLVANIPGSPGGARGSDVIKAGREHLEAVNKKLGRESVRLLDGTEVTAARRDGSRFLLETRDVKTGATARFRVRVLMIAAGMVDRQPWIGPEDRSIDAILPYANKGLAEYCLLCDGHTVAGKKVVVIGVDRAALGVATTLRDSFGADVTLVACIACATGEADHDESAHGGLFEAAAAEDLEAIDADIKAVTGLKEGHATIELGDGTRRRFDKAFLAMGWYKVNNGLAVALGGAVDHAGFIRTDADCQVLDEDGTPVQGLFAIGDLRAETWNQVPSAWADGETAAIHAWAKHL